MPRQMNTARATRRAKWRFAAAIAFASAILISSPGADSRETKRSHIVQAGESVAEIADYYGVSQRDLREINGIKENGALRVGRALEIPNVLRVPGKTYAVKSGDTVASIAAAFDRPASQIADANKIAVGAGLRVGRTLVIPDKGATSKRLQTKGQEIEPIVFLRVKTGERETLALYSKKGALQKGSVMRLSYLAREKGTNKVKRLNVRLVKMIQLLAAKFPGQPIEIISGYRASEVRGEESQHAFGRALDFRIPGVSQRQIFQFCKTLSRSGCGLYPKSGFVHMDAREKNATWME